ncbi:hypothetical protein KP509_07G015900 [Ceratopteris richardii]|uniref:Uncharacterized protein n=1 Tax=Ceratopteris richardii TaxID=49495 RepID=A0A8T2UCJ5_CERRI|nr:hypothetical protein KP509_07G015900 [Ceratopteris richardii]KAH7432261.1 hypothetical protein KP509_07G015900 [Ceratopteris richardii]
MLLYLNHRYVTLKKSFLLGYVKEGKRKSCLSSKRGAPKQRRLSIWRHNPQIVQLKLTSANTFNLCRWDTDIFPAYNMLLPCLPWTEGSSISSLTLAYH